MSGSNGWPPWLVYLTGAAPAGAALMIPKLWGAWRAWRGDVTTAQVAQERVDLDERVQIANRQVALDARADAEVARLAAVHAELRASLAAEVASGQHWYHVARAWWSRAWDKLGMARGLRADTIEAREGWADDRRGWFAQDPTGATAARRPEWMGPPPDFTTAEPPPIPDPPRLEDLKP